MITIRMSEANARWLLERVNDECGRLALAGLDTDPGSGPSAAWLERDALRDDLLAVLGDLDEKDQAGTMTPTERQERNSAQAGYERRAAKMADPNRLEWPPTADQIRDAIRTR